MKPRLHLLLPLLLAAVLLSYCCRPNAVLSPSKMQEVMRDMTLVQVYTERYHTPDSIALLYYDRVLEQHRVSRATYDSSLVWYGQNAPLLDGVYTEIIKEMEAQKELLDSQFTDSLDYEKWRYEPSKSGMWQDRNRLLLLRDRRFHRYKHELTELDKLESGDSLKWHAFIFPPIKLGESLYLELYLRGWGDTVVYKSGQYLGMYTDELEAVFELPTDTLPEIRSGAMALTFITHPDTLPKLHIIDRIDMQRSSTIQPPDEAEEPQVSTTPEESERRETELE
ncbi:MAG: DUF4296 domain-containing protein [Porphyromonas sp.]|nr:DUF4296 domain-containing protein [Porphyromonas sp.]